MHLITKAIVLMTLLSAESLEATINSHPTKGARWMAVPRTLQDAKHEIIDDREIRRRTDLFTRQTGCSPTEVACEGNACCPSGFTCYDTGGVTGCCPIGETCSGPPMGCADPNSSECPASIGGCCPNGQGCSLDSQGGPRCGDTTTRTTSAGTIYLSEAVPIYETTTASLLAETTVPIYSSGGNPTSRPTGSGSITGTRSGSITETGPRTTGTGNGVEKGMGMGMGMGLLLVPAVFVMLA